MKRKKDSDLDSESENKDETAKLLPSKKIKVEFSNLNDNMKLRSCRDW